jgi:ATP-binding cassette subfamily B protein
MSASRNVNGNRRHLRGALASHIPGGGAMSQDLALLRRVFREARPFRLHVFGVFVLTLLATPLALLTPVPLTIAVDSVIGSHPPPAPLRAILPGSVLDSKQGKLFVTVGLLILILAARLAQEAGSEVLRISTGQRLTVRFRARIFRQAQRLSLSYHDTHGTTDATYRVQYDAAAVQYVVVDALISMLTSAMTVVGMVAVTATIDWQLALIAVGVCPVLFVVARWYRTKLRAGWHATKAKESRAMSVIEEVLGALRIVKAFRQEDHEYERFVARSTDTVNATVRLAWLQGAYHLTMGLVIAVGLAAMLYTGVHHAESHVITLGELLLVFIYLTQLFEPLQKTSTQAASLQAALASAERAFSILDEAPDVREHPHARPLRRAGGSIAFRDVWFRYDGKRPALREVSFELPPQGRLGVEGVTGAGKSTLVNLLMRFYDPMQGEVLVDGRDVRSYQLADLRDQFAVVLQDPVLFSTTIAENIAYARPSATEAEIDAAAAAAGADAFIGALPDGYTTQVGERGLQLSGGERQRISLARAFLKDAPILILDEPTSSVDRRTEARIMEAMAELMQGRTSIMIAHRESTLEICDARLRIGGGTIVGASGRVRADVFDREAPELASPATAMKGGQEDG